MLQRLSFVRRLRQELFTDSRVVQERLRQLGGSGTVRTTLEEIRREGNEDQNKTKSKDMSNSNSKSARTSTAAATESSTPPNTVLRITLDNPLRANALCGKMLAELGDAVQTAVGLELQDPASATAAKPKLACVVIQGAGRHFCAGSDLNLLANATADTAKDMLNFMHTVTTCFKTLSVPTIALLQGDAIGGGSELVTMTDYQVADEAAARIRFVHARRGLTPGWGGAARLIHMVGAHRASQALMSARMFTAKDAHNYGLFSHLAPAGEAPRVCDDLVQTLTSNDPAAIASAKLLSLRGFIESLEASQDTEKEMFESAFARLQW
ncbi:hypothetical protein PTSG_02237 [Salpingoeca rosetta]|uniref:Ethylmalonyl-CoA decarboxylase n=1 Tax=Salpingoeca rosetta (strain ATCC 50818 / BSB-021) TaxID=946362 RepID=F2U1L6_SALR5|nr:uncharacterized protein PTSG_02237 [Salpingoeca rosetta]EGD81518.1 hypothetical protein PTSG_02237 [Salpingoeca rosetta]|eukprot:XP_004996722.1 hypothetical protein PTSG_02237 [Salpingoeca rosetta]